jgi:hypothetical protein
MLIRMHMDMAASPCQQPQLWVATCQRAAYDILSIRNFVMALSKIVCTILTDIRTADSLF